MEFGKLKTHFQADLVCLVAVNHNGMFAKIQISSL